jgi:peptidyl-prolyl cis-trans isomerase D
MLRGIHKASSSRLGKVIMTVLFGGLTVSFAIWGIGDIFRGFGQSELAKVGDTDIGIEEFRRAFLDRLQQFSQQVGKSVTTEQARAIGFDRQVLGQMIAQAALDERARQLGLAVSDKEIAQRIMSDANFQGVSGRFDQARFEAIIRQAGYTEARFIAEQRQQILRRQLLGTISGDLIVPKTEVEAIYRHGNEERAVDYVVLDAAQAGKIPPPSADTLAKYFEQQKGLFRAPEYRKLTVVVVTPEDLVKSITIPDADAKRVFDLHREQYSKPEKREVQQIVFPNAEAAKAASDRIAKGLSFDALAKERGLQPKDIDFGSVSKSEMIDPTIADAAFALKEGAVSAPVKGRFGTALVHVVKIEAGQTQSYEQVADQIKHNLALEQARNKVSDLRDKLEDDRAGGDTLAEAAQKLGLKVTTAEAVDRSGNGPDGKPVTGLPNSAQVLPAAFASDVGVENDPLQIQGGGFLWYNVAGITPSRERKLDEVKNEVETRWRNDEIAKRLQAKADAIVEKLKSGAAFKDVAAATGLHLQWAAGLKRGLATEAFPAKAIDAVFHTAKGKAGTAPGAEPTQRIVFNVTGVTVPKLDMNSADAKRIEDALRSAKANELLDQYVSQIESDMGVSVNQAALSQAIGGEAN